MVRGSVGESMMLVLLVCVVGLIVAIYFGARLLFDPRYKVRDVRFVISGNGFEAVGKDVTIQDKLNAERVNLARRRFVDAAKKVKVDKV